MVSPSVYNVWSVPICDMLCSLLLLSSVKHGTGTIVENIPSLLCLCAALSYNTAVDPVILTD